jgi:hypothetical protein
VVNPGFGIAFSDNDRVNSTRRRSNVHEVHNPILVRKIQENEQFLLELLLILAGSNPDVKQIAQN